MLNTVLTGLNVLSLFICITALLFIQPHFTEEKSEVYIKQYQIKSGKKAAGKKAARLGFECRSAGTKVPVINHSSALGTLLGLRV